jgi:hypothetical protein
MSSDELGHGTIQRTGRGNRKRIAYRDRGYPLRDRGTQPKDPRHLTLCVESVTPKRDERAVGLQITGWI